MQIGEIVIAKVDGVIKRCYVEEMHYEDVVLVCEGQKITRKYWEIRRPPNEE